MNRRSFVQMLGLAPLMGLAAKFFPKAIIMTNGDKILVSHKEPQDWEPSTCYSVGDRIRLSNGIVRTIRYAGISGPIEPLPGSELGLFGPRDPGYDGTLTGASGWCTITCIRRAR